jgi:hypothetical protein
MDRVGSSTGSTSSFQLPLAVLQTASSKCWVVPGGWLPTTKVFPQFEPATDPRKHKHLQKSIDEKAAKSKVFGAKSNQIPPGLAGIIAAWPHLPEPVKAGMFAMVQAYLSTDRTKESVHPSAPLEKNEDHNP